jgi:RNA polymerase sigma-70 factor (ECF subfamily)
MQNPGTAMANSMSADASPESRTFAELVHAHQGMVFSIAYHFLRDRFGAEEVAQDVFLQLHAKLGGLETSDHVVFWLRKVASHRSIDYARKLRRATVALEDAPELSVDTDPGDPMLRGRLRALIASLPETPRMAMILRYQEELMPEEIARVMDMPVRTVKSHLQRSLAMLREKIERSMGEVT